MLEALVMGIFISVMVLVFSIASLVAGSNPRARMLRERLESLDQAAQRGSSEEVLLLRDELLSEIPALHRLLSRSSSIGRLQKFLSQADVRVRAGKFLLICTCCAAVAGMVTTTWSPSLLFALFFTIAGGALPFLYVSFRRTRRFHKFEELFPEAIEFLARATRAGHAFPTALELIGTEMAEPVSGEFRKLFEEQKFGLPMRDALFNLSERMPILDVKFFVTAVMLQRETGGNLAEILDKLSYVIRERFKILRQVRVFTAQGRLTLGILMALPPVLVVGFMVINPDFISPLFTTALGHTLIVVSVTLQTIGFFLIRRIIHIQV